MDSSSKLSYTPGDVPGLSLTSTWGPDKGTKAAFLAEAHGMRQSGFISEENWAEVAAAIRADDSLSDEGLAPEIIVAPCREHVCIRMCVGESREYCSRAALRAAMGRLSEQHVITADEAAGLEAQFDEVLPDGFPEEDPEGDSPRRGGRVMVVLGIGNAFPFGFDPFREW